MSPESQAKMVGLDILMNDKELNPGLDEIRNIKQAYAEKASDAKKNVAAAEQTQKQRQHSGGSPLPVLFWLMVIGFVALSHFRRGYGRRYRGRGGGIARRRV